MMRVAIRGSIVILALVLAVASAGTVMCEMNCAACGNETSGRTITDEGTNVVLAANNASSSVVMAHCHGDRNETARNRMPASHDPSGGTTNHHGVHVHPRIVATAVAGISISLSVSIFRAIHTVSNAVPAVYTFEFSSNNNSSPPINSPFVFAAGVLRI
jgi:hypothetical protein